MSATIVHPLPKSPLNEQGRSLVQYAREIAESQGEQLAGFVIVAWGADGRTSSAGDTSAKTSPIPRVLIPAFITEVLRRDFVMDHEIRDELQKYGIISNSPPEEPA